MTNTSNVITYRLKRPTWVTTSSSQISTLSCIWIALPGIYLLTTGATLMMRVLNPQLFQRTVLMTTQRLVSSVAVTELSLYSISGPYVSERPDIKLTGQVLDSIVEYEGCAQVVGHNFQPATKNSSGTTPGMDLIAYLSRTVYNLRNLHRRF